MSATKDGMDRRCFMGTLAAAAAAGLGAGEGGAGKRRPNVVYLFSDEHRYQSMCMTDMPGLQTPHMAALAEQGVSFTNCISNYPVCSPHRAILMTSQWPYRHGVIDNNHPLRHEEETIGKAFQRAGYHTGYIGKWHLGGLSAEPMGFDHSLIWSGTNDHWNTSRYHPQEGEPVQPKGYNATLMSDQALAYMDERVEHEDPFFLMVSWNPPHSVFTDAPESKLALYPEGSLRPRGNAALSRNSEEKQSLQIWNQNAWRYYRGYHAHVNAIDDELGRVMAKLDELGIAEDTLLVYTSDHGSMLGSHGLGSKRQPYEESVRVPFLVRWPGIVPAGQVSDTLLGTIDLMPSLCGLAHVPAPDTCQGQDLSPHFRGESGPEQDSQFIMHISKKNASHGDKHPAPLFRGVRTKRHTYAVYPDKPWCLFDNARDPYQQTNLIDDPEYAALRKALHRSLAEWLVAADDPFVLPLEAS